MERQVILYLEFFAIFFGLLVVDAVSVREERPWPWMRSTREDCALEATFKSQSIKLEGAEYEAWKKEYTEEECPNKKEMMGEVGLHTYTIREVLWAANNYPNTNRSLCFFVGNLPKHVFLYLPLIRYLSVLLRRPLHVAVSPELSSFFESVSYAVPVPTSFSLLGSDQPPVVVALASLVARYDQVVCLPLVFHTEAHQAASVHAWSRVSWQRAGAGYLWQDPGVSLVIDNRDASIEEKWLKEVLPSGGAGVGFINKPKRGGFGKPLVVVDLVGEAGSPGTAQVATQVEAQLKKYEPELMVIDLNKGPRPPRPHDALGLLDVADLVISVDNPTAYLAGGSDVPLVFLWDDSCHCPFHSMPLRDPPLLSFSFDDVLITKHRRKRLHSVGSSSKQSPSFFSSQLKVLLSVLQQQYQYHTQQQYLQHPRQPNNSPFDTVLQKFSASKILVVGDLFLDKYTEGSVSKTSLEFPVIVLEKKSERSSPGAAGNLACNFAALQNSQKPGTFVVGNVGGDNEGDELISSLNQCGVGTTAVNKRSGKPTNVYHKFWGGVGSGKVQEVMRVDSYPDPVLPAELESQFFDSLCPIVRENSVQAVVFADQESSVVTRKLVLESLRCCKENHCFVVGTSRYRLTSGLFDGVDVLVSNADEVHGKGASSNSDLSSLLDRLSDSAVIFVTDGADGIVVHQKRVAPFRVPIPKFAQDQGLVKDTTGAGDSTLAAIVTALASEASIEEAATIGVTSGSLSVLRDGCVTVPQSLLWDSLKTSNDNNNRNLLNSYGNNNNIEEVFKLILESKWRNKISGKKLKLVLFTGVFDVMHSGYTNALNQAESLGDLLVVGINSDSSLEQLSIPQPIFNQDQRREVLLSLSAVDHVVVFDDDGVSLLRKLQPNIFVKDGEITSKEGYVVKQHGGEVVSIPVVSPVYHVPNSSTPLVASSNSARSPPKRRYGTFLRRRTRE